MKQIEDIQTEIVLKNVSKNLVPGVFLVPLPIMNCILIFKELSFNNFLQLRISQ